MPIDPSQYRTPLFDAMVSLAESRKVSFHTPGHKSGKGISTRFSKYVGHKIFSIDLTTLDEVDSLQKPVGVIKEAQELAAKAYGCDRSFFLVNGTSVGNHAMVMAACATGDRILLARNCHRSVLAGVILSGADPRFIYPEFDDRLKMSLNVSFDTVKDAVDENPGVEVLLITSPNYYGICSELGRITEFAHARGMSVLVDEAHGPHLGFHGELPASALSCGADMCVQSTHKIIGGMTQASMLHAREGRVKTDSLAGILKFIQTTSPSYILMASLDLARMQMATEGEKLLGQALSLSRWARAAINRVGGLHCLEKDEVTSRGLGDLDETKLTINVSGLGRTGYEVSQMLNHEFGIQAEMADPYHVLLIVSIGDRREDISLLVNALEMIAQKPRPAARAGVWDIGLPDFRNVAGMTPREAFFSEHDYLPLPEAVGRLSSDIVTVYPPGIPILVPGEEVSGEVIKYLDTVRELGGTVDGLTDEGLIGVVG